MLDAHYGQRLLEWGTGLATVRKLICARVGALTKITKLTAPFHSAAGCLG